MKTREVENILRNKGMDRGVVYMLEYLVEKTNSLEKNLVDCAQLLNALVDTVSNLTNASSEAISQQKKLLARHGIAPDEDDGLDPSTHNIGVN